MRVLLLFFGCIYQISSNPVKVTNSTPAEFNDVNPSALSHIMAAWQSKNATAHLIEATINEVQSMLAKDPKLPRLTRGEILDLIENMTKTDLEKIKQQRSRFNDQRAIMLVLPYSPNNNTDAGNLQELYTKPPVIRIIDDQTDKPKTGSNLEDINTKPPILKLIDDQAGRSEMKPVRRRRPTLPPTIPQLEISSTTATPFESTKPTSISTTTEHLLTTSTTTRQNLLTPKTIIIPKYEVRKPIKGAPHRKYVNKYAPSRFSDRNTVLSDQGLKVIQPPKINLPSFEQKIPQDQDEILIAQESLPPKATESQMLNDFLVPHHLQPVLEDIDFNTQQVGIIYKKPQKVPSKIPNFFTSTTTPGPDMASVADNLTPEMKNLLISFGLISDPAAKRVKKKPEVTYVGPDTPKFEPESFIQFKPLPDDAPTREEMESFLAGFGLGSGARQSKMKTSSSPKQQVNSPPEVEMEIFPDEMKEVIADLGLVERNGKKISLKGVEKAKEKRTISSKTDYDRELEDLKKLKELLDIVKLMDTMNDTEVLKRIDLKHVKELVTSLNQSSFAPLDARQNSPNPFLYEYPVQRNAIKRQGSDDTVTTTEESASVKVEGKGFDSSEESFETTTLSTTTNTEAETAETPNLKDLEDSFGGSPTTTSTTTTTTTTEPPVTTRKSGFYYLVDWNTFLEVDDQRGKRVNIRYQPKSGDPKRFYSVTVP